MELTDNLTLGVPITCEDIGTIYQPNLEELLSYGDYIRLFYPFMISKKLFPKEIEENEEIKDFDLFFLIDDSGKPIIKGQSSESILDEIVESIAFFYKTENIRLLHEEQMIVINESIVITRENYEKLASIILLMAQKERLVKEEEIHFKSKRLKALHEKLERNRAETRRRNAILLSDMINTLSVNPVRGFTYKEIKEMTLWQLHNNYSQIMQIDRHELMMKYKVSEKYNIEDEIKHWSKENKMQRIEI